MAHRLLILISALSLFAGEQLNQRDAKRLVENTPDFINAAKADHLRRLQDGIRKQRK